MRELLSFLYLYIDDSNLTADSFGVMFIMLHVNAIFFILDFYGLMKRKSGKETAAIMAVPGILSLVGATLMGFMVYVPKQEELGQFALALQSSRLHIMLLGLILLYGVLWAASLYFHKIYKNNRLWRFVLSCILDYVCAAMILICSISALIQNEASFLFGFDRILWFYLHAVYLLICKLVLLAVGLVVRLYCSKLTFFRWREGKNAPAFLFRYFAFYQNAMIRGILLFELGILIPFTIAFIKEGWNLLATGIMGFLYLCGAFVTIVNLSPCMNMLDRFGQWGNSLKTKEMFCREYFCEEAVFRNENYTVTRHFLIDEQMPAAVYYWPTLNKVENWSYDKKGKNRSLRFSDGTCCRFSEEEVLSSVQVFQYAKKHLAGEKISPEGTEKKSSVISAGESSYDKMVKKMAYFLVAIMMCVSMFVSFFSKFGGPTSGRGQDRIPFSERDPDMKPDFDKIYLVHYTSYEYGGNGFAEDALTAKREYKPDFNNPRKFNAYRNTYYTYDQEGRLIYEEYTSAGYYEEPPELSTTAYEYTENGSVKIEISEYWDYERISTKDKMGNMVLYEEKLYFLTSRSEINYDEKGRLLLYTKFTNREGSNNSAFHQLRVVWDDTQSVRTVMSFEDPDGEPIQVWIDSYSEDGRRLDCGYSGNHRLIGLSPEHLPENLREYCYQAYWADYDAEGRRMECAGQDAGTAREIMALLQYDSFSIYSYYAFSYTERGLMEWEISCSNEYLYLKHYLYDENDRLMEEFTYKICTDEWEQILSDGSVLTFTREDSKIQSICRRAADGSLINELIYEDGEILLQHTAEGEILWKEAKKWLASNMWHEPDYKPDHKPDHDSEPQQTDRYIEVQRGDNLWNLAESFYGDGFLWWKIYKENLDIIGDDPSLIYEGMYLKIPE